MSGTEGCQEGSVRIADVTELADFEQCVDVQLAVWGYSDGDLIPKRVFVVAKAIGGQVIGAFEGKTMIGFAMSLPGHRDGKAYLHSHMLAVLPAYRNSGLGRLMKVAQRDDALKKGFERIEWTFDPLEIKNAHLNIARLGAIVRRYMPDFYGPSTSPLQGSLPTDRLVAEWWIRSERVGRVLGELSNGNPQDVAKVGGKDVERIAVPAAVYEWKRNPEQRSLALTVQIATRHALQDAFARGLAVTGYERSPQEDGCFVLEPLSEVDLGPRTESTLQNRTTQC
ncbi:MAG TPA: GNAT family N-acetyltransferase [Acidobacteriaceae bacterium]|jgi:predicted GNAT superfamily acetyltransferase|nr:GNAT family N-acetyltransferase [Acidobacteriaceae bacterium]